MTRADAAVVAGFLSLLALAQVALEALGAPLRFERQAIAGGQLWRLVSGHFVHLGWQHLALNAAAAVLLVLLHGQPRRALCLCVLLAPLLSVALYLLAPQVGWYVGLSGVLHGLFAWCALDLINARERIGWVCLVGLAGKLAYELVGGPDTLTSDLIGGVVITEAHGYGAVLAVFCWLVATRFWPSRTAAD